MVKLIFDYQSYDFKDEQKIPAYLDWVEELNVHKISLLEGSIVIWTKQIKNVLKQDPEELLKQGLHPTPDAEIEFWKLKAAR